MTTKNTTTTTTNAKRQRALDLAKKRIGDCRNITPEMLVDADKATKTIASVTKHPLVLDISDERDRGDGIWVYLRDGWISDILETSTIHEDTWAECISLLKEVYFDRSTMDDKDDDAPKQASAPEASAPEASANEQASAPEANEEGFGEAMTIEQIMAINAKRQQATKAPEAKAIRIASLNAMRETIQTKINAIRAQNNGEGWHKHKDEAKASAWRILIDDLLFVDASIHNANLGFVDVASVRQRILRSL